MQQDSQQHSESLKQTPNDPLLACLIQMTHLKDTPCSETSLIAGLPLVDQRLTPELFVRAVNRAGLEAKVLKRSLYDIPSLVLPVVLLLDNNDAVILLQIDGKDMVLLHPSTGEQSKTPMTELSSRYSGYAIYVKNQHNIVSINSDLASESKGHRWFWSVINSSWRIYRDVILASFFINLFAIATPLFVMNVYDRVVPNQAIETLWVLAIGVMVVYFFDLILKGLRAYFIELAGKKSDILLSSTLYERVLGARYSERPLSVGAFVSQFREFDTVRSFYTSSTITILVDIPFILLFLLLIYYVGGALVWVPITAIPIILAYGLITKKPIKEAVENTFVSAAYKNSNLVESLVGLETVKLLLAEGFLQRLWEKSVGHLAHWSQRLRLLSISVALFSGTIQQIAGVIVIIAGVYLTVERELTMGALIACYMLTSRAMGPISQVASLLVSYDQTKTALSALDEIVGKPQERQPEKPFVQRPTFAGAIQFKHVTFCYPGEKIAALDDISFCIKPGEKVAIIGRIGSGKSTIHKLISGLYQPTQGSLLFDGIDSQQIDPADLRNHIGYVPQDIVLFAGTIKSNIAYGRTHITDQDIVQVAELAGVKEFVDHHPLGFDRSVGERGQSLSGGQRQSIGIARALLNQPIMCLLDEPTSGMDNSTETLIKQNLSKVLKDSTLVLVTHKTSLLSLVDRVIVLDGGKMVADGAKEQVLDALKKGQLHVAQP